MTKDLKKASSNRVICKMAEYDLACNLEKGAEYTGFKGLYNDCSIKKGHVSEHGVVYNVSNSRNSEHILLFFEKIKPEEEPNVIMTSGTFFSMNKKLRKDTAKHLISLSEKIGVVLYVGEDVSHLFKGTNVQVKVYDRQKRHIPHFIITALQFLLALPHNEQKLIRVNISSQTFDPQAIRNINNYLYKLIAELDTAIANDRMDSK
jgi:predicted transcriptional regulator